MNLRFASFLAISTFVWGCGSRSDISLDDALVSPGLDASVPHDAAIHDAALHDAEASAPHDAGIDARPVPDSAPSCPEICDDDGIACTVDGCDPKTLACVHNPDDARCPAGLKCDGITGCVSILYAVTASSLYEVTLPAGTLRLIGSKLPFTDDVALAPDGTLYVVDNDLVIIDRVTGDSLGRIAIGGTFGELTALDAAPDGTLYAGASDSDKILRIDPKNTTIQQVGSFPDGYLTSGDLAFVNGRLFGTVKKGRTSATDFLVEVNVTTGVSRLIGDLGVPCVWGLAAVGNTLYGFTCKGNMITIDTSNATTTAIAQVGVSFNGATSR